MFTICEGIDLSGKSTFAAQVADEIAVLAPNVPAQLLHRGPPERHPLEEYAYDIENYRPNGEQNIVADRWHWGELIYGPIYRGKSELGIAGFRWLELFLKARGVITVHVTQTLKELDRRRELRGEDLLKPEDVETVFNEYKRFAGLAITTQGVVAPHGDMRATAQLVAQYAQIAEKQAAVLVDFPQYIGSVRPRVLLVGEQRGGTGPWPTAAPFGTEVARSGRFLFEALPEEFWRTVGVVNVKEVDISGLVNAIRPEIVVALGRNASDGLLDADIEHAGVPHPAYIKRFWNKRQVEYGALIKQVADTGEAKFSWPS